MGESDTCSTGLDCGAYILAHHKLWTGEVEIAQADPEPVIPEGCVDAECNSCSSDYYKKNGNCTVKPAACDLNIMGDCTFSDGNVVKLSSIGDLYVAYYGAYETLGSLYKDHDSAVDICSKNGMELASRSQYNDLWDLKTSYPDSIPQEGWYWAKDIYSNGNPWSINMGNNDYIQWGASTPGTAGSGVLCVKTK